MPEPQAYLGGQFLPCSQAVIPVSDMGFVLGTTVTEQLRTFSGRLFHLQDHLRRLEHSLAVVGVEAPLNRDEMAKVGQRLVEQNRSLIDEGDDLGLSIFVTPGPYATLNDGRGGLPLVGMHTYQLPFSLWADKYQQGASLATTDVQQVSPRCWPPELKCRSRMHYYLADRAAAERHPGARALLTDADGFVTEASTANLVVYYADEGLVAPPHEKVLPGISLAVVLLQLADKLGIPHQQRDLRPADVAAADEVMLSSTPFCLLPVTGFNGRPIGDGSGGPVFRRLLDSWSQLVGVDIAEQARRFANRSV